jgi:hypothetical protein
MRFYDKRRDTCARRVLKRGLLALVTALGVLALGPASALAAHFTGTTKRCNAPTGNYECVLDISAERTSVPSDIVIIDLQGNATYATTPARTGGTCPPTSVNVVSPTRLNVPINFTPLAISCTIVLQETLTATGEGGFPCQVLDYASGENTPPLQACATLASPPIQPLRPTSKDQCKDGGWQTFGVFKNQGDCVSFVATGGKNPPGKTAG